MMSVDVEIYMSNIIKFFRENPNELTNLVLESKKDKFFDKVRETATSNADKGEDVSLTRQQLIDICLNLNGKINEVIKNSNLIIPTLFGEYSLN